MPDQKISALVALGAEPASNDLVPIVDVSDTTQAATGSTKKVTVSDLLLGSVKRTLVDAKGDLILGTGADVVGRKAVGANGTILIADSADATGVVWRVLADADIPAAIARDSEVVPITIFDAKGDMLVGTGADTYMRKPVGNNGEFYIANSAQASGTEWRPIASTDLPSTGPRDLLGYVRQTSGGPQSQSASLVTVISKAVTIPAGRLVEITAQWMVDLTVSSSVHGYIHTTAAGGTFLGRAKFPNLAVAGDTTLQMTALNNSLSGTQTISLQCQHFSGLASYNGNASDPILLIIKDIGAI